jgi:hypothetical protein
VHLGEVNYLNLIEILKPNVSWLINKLLMHCERRVVQCEH